jgi:hypothetical protein
MIDGASVKRGLWNGLKLKFHRYIGQLRPSTTASSETAWRRFIVHGVVRNNIYIGFRHVIIIGSRDRRVGVWWWRWRASGFAWCVRSQVVGIATRRGARDETGARPARARPAQAMRLTANTKRKP